MTETPPEQPQQPPPERPAAPSVGPLALEAALLLDVVADRLESMKTPTASATPTGKSATGKTSSTDEADPPGADDEEPAAATGRCPECGSVPGASCTACPLCRFMALLRGERPEATAKLVDGALMIIRTLRSLVPDPPAQPARNRQPAAGSASTHRPSRWPRTIDIL